MNQSIHRTCECLNTTADDCQTTAIKHRLARSAGHLKSVLRMIEEEENLNIILFQLRAVQESIRHCSVLILERHLRSCKNTKSLEEIFQEVLFLLHDDELALADEVARAER